MLEREKSDSVIATLCYLECIVKKRERCKERKKYDPYTGKNSQIKFSERVQLLEILDRVQYSLTYIPLYNIYHGKSWLIGKDPDAGKDWRWEEKGMTEDEMVGWHHWLNGHESEQAPRVGDGQGKPGVLQSIGSQRVRHEWVTEHSIPYLLYLWRTLRLFPYLVYSKQCCCEHLSVFFFFSN